MICFHSSNLFIIIIIIMEHIKDFLENGNFLVNLGKPAPPVNQTFHCTPFVLVKVIVFQQKSFKIKHKQQTACLNLINRILI